MKIINYLLLFISSFITQSVMAQMPTDAIMMNGKQACILLDYNFSSFDHYWEGSNKRNNPFIATIQRHTTLGMMAAGITDNLNVFIGLPYVATKSTEPNGGRLAGVNGIQDFSIAVKYRWIHKNFGDNQLSLLTTLGFSTPASNYLSDYMPYSLGFGASEFSYRAIAQYKLAQGWYIRGTGSYLWRGYTKIERDYYYADGSFYTPWMDVPNALHSEVVAGKWFFKNALQFELSYARFHSMSGDDIRAYNKPQPTNKVDFDRVGLFAHYYFPTIKGLGLVGYHYTVISGRNAPEQQTTGCGITYFFNYSK